MLMHYHLFLSLLLVLVLYPFFGHLSWIAYLTTIIIDVDHLYIYIFKKIKKFGLKQTLRYTIGLDKETKLELDLYPLHTIEVLLVIFILSFYYKVFVLILIGLVYHLIIDCLWDRYAFKKIYKEFSLIQWIIKKISL